MTLRAALATFFNRFNNELQIDLDEAYLMTFLAQGGCIKDDSEPPV